MTHESGGVVPSAVTAAPFPATRIGSAPVRDQTAGVGVLLNGHPIRTVATDFGGTISGPRVLHRLGQKPLDPEAAETIRWLHLQGLRLLLVSNSLPCETRWPALEEAGVADLFAVVLASHALGVAKPEPIIYELTIAAAQCPAEQILFIGNSFSHDVLGPTQAGMWACHVADPGSWPPPPALPARALRICHFRDLPDLLTPAGAGEYA